MKLSGTFPCDFSPQVYQKYLADEGALSYLCRNHPEILHVEAIENRAEEDKVYLKLKYTMEVAMPGPVKKALGGASHSFVADLILDSRNDTATLEFNPARLSDKIKAGARIAFQPDGERWMQRLDGDVTVKILGLGRVVEKFMVDKFRNSYSIETRLRNEYIKTVEVECPAPETGVQR